MDAARPANSFTVLAASEYIKEAVLAAIVSIPRVMDLYITLDCQIAILPTYSRQSNV